MAVGQILTQGLGSFSSASYVITLGYLSGDAPTPTPTPTPPAPVSGGGGWVWNPVNYLNKKRKELADSDLPKQVKKAIKEVAKLNLAETDAEIALRLRTQEIAWQQQFIEYSMELQRAMEAARIHEANKLQSRLMQGALIAEQYRLEAQAERERRIQIIMQLI